MISRLLLVCCRALYLLLGSLTGGVAAAGDVLPERFVRVRSMAAPDAGAVYLIGATTPADGGFYLMSNSDGSRRLRADRYGEASAIAEEIAMPDAALMWQLVANSDGTYALISADNGKRIYAPDAGKVDLLTDKSRQTAWTLSCADGLFVFSNADNPERKLGIYHFDGNTYFKNFTASGADSYTLYLYRGVAPIEEGTQAEWPTDGATVVLCGGNYLAGTNATAVAADGYLLQDGAVAPDEGMGQWRVERLADSCFVMRSADGASLGYSLTPETADAVWQIRNGCIQTCELSPRILCCDGERFGAVPAAEAAYRHRATFRPIGAAPAQSLNEGCLTLTGAWSIRRLAALDWSDAHSLDLTAAILPQHPASLTSRPADRNTVIYVDEAARTFVPEDWNLVVACGATDNYLLTASTVADRQPLHIVKDFRVESGRLTYSRQAYADGYWETLCLPFDATLPPLFEGEYLTAVDGGELTFEAAEAIAANEPLIIRYKGTAGTALANFTVSAREGLVSQGQPMGGGVFTGVYSPLAVSSATDNIYLLNSRGDAFVRADAGSRLAPFRAYITTNTAAQRLRVRHSGATSVTAAEVATDAAVPCYHIDGRVVTPHLTEEMRSRLPAGVYIIDKKKVIIQ